jgi:hypothetical protein
MVNCLVVLDFFLGGLLCLAGPSFTSMGEGDPVTPGAATGRGSSLKASHPEFLIVSTDFLVQVTCRVEMDVIYIA